MGSAMETVTGRGPPLPQLMSARQWGQSWQSLAPWGPPICLFGDPQLLRTCTPPEFRHPRGGRLFVWGSLHSGSHLGTCQGSCPLCLWEVLTLTLGRAEWLDGTSPIQDIELLLRLARFWHWNPPGVGGGQVLPISLCPPTHGPNSHLIPAWGRDLGGTHPREVRGCLLLLGRAPARGGVTWGLHLDFSGTCSLCKALRLPATFSPLRLISREAGSEGLGMGRSLLVPGGRSHGPIILWESGRHCWSKVCQSQQLPVSSLRAGIGRGHANCGYRTAPGEGVQGGCEVFWGSPFSLCTWSPPASSWAGRQLEQAQLLTYLVHIHVYWTRVSPPEPLCQSPGRGV